MSKTNALKKPTLESLAAEMRRLEERIEDMEDLIELRLAIERNQGKLGTPWESSEGRAGTAQGLIMRRS